MNTRLARYGSVVVLLALLVGTLMPGSWKHSALQPVPSPVDLAMVAHVSLFAALAFLLPFARWWRMKPWHIPAVCLGLALLTEGLQFFAIDRHPNLAGVAQDLAGTLMGWAAARAWSARLSARLPRAADRA